MIGVAANHRPQTDDRCVLPRFGELLRHDRDFKRAGDAHHVDVGIGNAMTVQRIERPADEWVNDNRVEASRNYGESAPG